MSLETLSSPASNRSTRTQSKANISSDLVIPKPLEFAKKCPIASQSQSFPAIKSSTQKKKPKTKSVSSSDSLEFWLKPGISLPKLHSKAATDEKVEVDKPCTRFSYSNFPERKADSELGETWFAKPVKCLQAKSEDFPVSSDIVGLTHCQDSFRVPSSEFNLRDKLELEEEPIIEDNALKQWRKWNKRHKMQQKYLCDTTKKKPYDLLFQKSDLYRQTLEDKTLFLSCNMPKADKWRGHPYAWLNPIVATLKQDKIGKSPGEISADYVLQKTRIQKGILPDLEFIRTPKVVRMEKFLEYSKDCSHEFLRPNLKIGFNSLMEERIQSFLKLKDTLIPLEDFDNMAIVGTKIPEMPQEVVPEPSVVYDVPQIKVTGPENENCCQDTRQSVFCLIINGTEIKYAVQSNVPWRNNDESVDYTWDLDFGVTQMGKRIEKTLQVENRGTMAVRYNWVSKNIERRQGFNKLVPESHEPWFFFNKNSGIFLPGQFYDLKFYLRSKKPGIRTETWYLETFPPLGKNGGCGKIIFSAVASIECQDLKWRIIETYLSQRVRDSIVKFIIDIILEKVFNSNERYRDLEYESLFLDKQLFEYQNSKYYYHSETVRELRELFKKIPFKIQNHWDLSLDSLIKIISLSTQGSDRKNLICNVYELAQTLLKPVKVFSRKGKKHRMAYNILCKMINYMEDDYNYLRKILSNKYRDLGSKSSEKNNELGETISTSLSSLEKCDLDSGSTEGSMYEIKTINLIYFQTMFYIKVYHRVSNAVEDIVGMLETSKKFEPSRNDDYEMPWRSDGDFSHCIQIFPK